MVGIFDEYRFIVTNIGGGLLIAVTLWKFGLTSLSTELKLILSLLLWSLLGLVIAENYSFYFRGLKKFASAVGLMYVIFEFVSKGPYFKSILGGFTAGFSIVGIDAFIFGRATLLGESDRLTGSVGNANGLALFMILGLFGLIYFAIYERSRLKLLFIFTLALILIANIFFTASRKATLTLIIMFVLIYLFVLMIKGNTGKKIFYAIAIIPLIYLGQFAYESIFVNSYLEQRFNDAIEFGEVGGRDRLIIEGINIIASNPIFGVGLGNFKAYSSGLGAHNDFIDITVSLGIIGLIIYLSFYVIIIKRNYSHQKYFKTRKELQLASLSTIFIAIMVLFHLGREMYYDIYVMPFIILSSSRIIYSQKLLKFQKITHASRTSNQHAPVER